MVVVSCSSGHRFPVNLLKHLDRPYRLCPRCGEEVVVRKKHIFSPNPRWQTEKEDRQSEVKRLKAMRQRQPAEPVVMPGALQSARLTMMALAMMRQMQKEREEKKRA